VFSEADWCPVTEEQALVGPANGYRASKTFAVSEDPTSIYSGECEQYVLIQLTAGTRGMEVCRRE
jgi:hypothetical protein